MKTLFTAFLSLIFTFVPLVSVAQDYPATDTEIHGRVLNFDGEYQVEVQDEAGKVDEVRMHQGTIINPLGLRLQQGMVVDVFGYPSEDFFVANEIDTPYYYSNGEWFYADHPWYYYSAAGFGLGFFFGSGALWIHHHYGPGYVYYHSGYGHPGYRGYASHANYVNHGYGHSSFHSGNSFHSGGHRR